MNLPKAACLLFVAPTGRLLTVTRRNSEVFSLPGGKVDEGETPFEAACRETREETGLEVETCHFLYRGECEAGADGKAFNCYTFLVLTQDESPVSTIETGIVPSWRAWDELLSQPVFTAYNRAIHDRYTELSRP